MSEPRKGNARRALALLIGLAAGLALAEAASRIPGIAPEVWPRPLMIENPGKTFGLDCYPTDPRGSFPTDLGDPEQLEDAARRGGWDPSILEGIAGDLPHCVPFEYNDLTYRDSRFEPAPAGTSSVLVIGDSFTEGQGVVAEHTFTSRLQAMLAGRRDLPRTRVRNAGRRGRDLPGIMDALEDLLQILKPDVVVYAFMLNDFEQDEPHRSRQEFLNDLVLDRQHTGHPTWKLPRWLSWSALAVLVAERVRTARVSKATRDWYSGMIGPGNVGGWTRTRRDLERMRDLVQQSGGRFIVAVLPLLVGLEGHGSRYPFRGLHEDLDGAMDGMSIARVDLLPAFVGHRTEDLWVHPVDMHPNDEAHLIIAESLLAPVAGALAPGSGRP